MVTRSSNTPRTYDRRGGSGLRAIVTHHGPTTARGWGVRAIVKHRGPTTAGGWGVRAIVKHHGPTAGGGGVGCAQ